MCGKQATRYRQVMKHMSSSYLRRVRLVCNGWAAFAGRFCTDLKPEYLPDGGRRLATRFPYLRLLDLSHCSEIVIHAKVPLCKRALSMMHFGLSTQPSARQGLVFNHVAQQSFKACIVSPQ